MFNMEDVLSGNLSSYPVETQEYLKKYTEELRESIKEELINKLAYISREDLVDMLTEVLENGFKGYNKMSTRILLNIYLEKNNEENFIKLLENINVE